ncbi:phage tail protein [Paraburkholderia sp.]|uniref:phage tail protein n=1 Tax=Paraburkholderia sp. TaxID=1926495 RepID=UPI003D6E5F4C
MAHHPPHPDARDPHDPPHWPIWPIGIVVPYAGLLAATDASSGILDQVRAGLCGQGWLYCDGSTYSMRAYWELYGVIGKSFGGDTTTFNVPDLRGRFVRGVDGGAGHDADAGARIAQPSSGASGDHVGSCQADALEDHEHACTSTPGSPRMHDDPHVASDPRARNLSLNYLIRYR